MEVDGFVLKEANWKYDFEEVGGPATIYAG